MTRPTPARQGVLTMREDDLPTVDSRFTLALISDLIEVLARHGYPAPTDRVLVELCWGIHQALHARPFDLI
jgi:hypothetical protein